MPSVELARVAVGALRLQNGYAQSIDTRDWGLFRTLFASDVVAEYPNGRFEGIDEWLGFFVPFHDGCGWIQHVMTNHVVGEDIGGLWGWCYGDVQWTHRDRPGRVNRSRTLYRDRLRAERGTWAITRRSCDLIMSQLDVPTPDVLTFPNSVLDVADVARRDVKGTN
jgi:hypothetical protein